MEYTKFGYVRRPCPTCGEHGRSVREVSSADRAEDTPFEKLKTSWDIGFSKMIYFSYHRCVNCQILFCPIFFSSRQLEELYRTTPDNTQGIPLATVQKTQENYFQTLSKYSPLMGEYLEIGPDIGLFTEIIAKNGNFSRFWLFEPKQNVVETLRSKLVGRDYKIISDMFSFDAISEQSISLAVMVHVLDHIAEPVSYLAQLRKRLNKSSTLLIVTHDESSLLAKITRNRWAAYSLQHPQVFRAASMKNLLKASGFTTITTQKTVNHFPFMFLVKRALWTLGFGDVPLGAMHRFSVPVRLGNFLTLATPAENCLPSP